MNSEIVNPAALDAEPKDVTAIKEKLDKIIASYRGFYDVNMVDPISPFYAEATFRLYDEQYLLIKAAKFAESTTTEFVYFAGVDVLTTARYNELQKIAWEDCLRRAEPKVNHRNTDATLVIVADRVEDDCVPVVKKSKQYKSYKYSFHGWSTYRAVVCDLSRETILFNRRGRELDKIYSKIKVF